MRQLGGVAAAPAVPGAAARGRPARLAQQVPARPLHPFLHLPAGQTVELILQNQRAGAFGGEYNTSAPLTSARNGVEQHPFHLHGQARSACIRRARSQPGARKLAPPHGRALAPLARCSHRRLYAGGAEWLQCQSPPTPHTHPPHPPHPHWHAQHFWIVGMGFGQWAPNATANYTLAAAPLRDTATLLFDPASSTPGWTAIRFKANNPGAPCAMSTLPRGAPAAPAAGRRLPAARAAGTRRAPECSVPRRSCRRPSCRQSRPPTPSRAPAPFPGPRPRPA